MLYMDFDGLLLLMDRDTDKFEEWYKKSEKLSLEELENCYKEWKAHYTEMHEKYKNLASDEVTKDVTLYSAKTTYFYMLTNFTLKALTAYTTKLKHEWDSLKSKSIQHKKSKNLQNHSKTKKSSKKQTKSS